MHHLVLPLTFLLRVPKKSGRMLANQKVGAERVTKIVATLPDGKICDYIDQKIRNDTPEEYVRQNIERRLVLELGYSREQIAVEFPIKIGSGKHRVDLAIFPDAADHSQDNISIIIECKKDSVEPSNKNEGTEQLKSYMSACPTSCVSESSPTFPQPDQWLGGRFAAVSLFHSDQVMSRRIALEEAGI